MFRLGPRSERRLSGTGISLVEDKASVLRDEDRATLARLFTSDRMASYRADEWKGTGDGKAPKPSNGSCADGRLVCEPAPAGTPPQGCLCVPPQGMPSVLQYDVAYQQRKTDTVLSAQYTFRGPMAEMTTEMITELEAMRAFHFGK